MFKQALVSVSDKTGLIEFLQPFVDQGLRIVSTGGTARHLREHGFKVIDVSEQTGFPEVMDGRVKTLHPMIHMALLARDHVGEDFKTLKKYNLEPFDLVVGNLYAFEDALKKDLKERDLIEYIDVGGPSFLRAAAKSYERITVVCRPDDYNWIAEKNGKLTNEERRHLAAKVFAHVSAYDSMIASELGAELGFSELSWGGEKVLDLRYGENPQQKAGWYRRRGARSGLHSAQILQGKALSYNNLLDLEASCSAVRMFAHQPACVAVKHNNPCGVAVGNSAAEAVNKALAADPVSVFGGIVAVNRPVDEEAAHSLQKLFLECVVAPEYSPGALRIFAEKKNLRVLTWPELMNTEKSPMVVSVAGGFLVQTKDEVEAEWSSTWEVVGENPSESVRRDLLFTWQVCAQLKSNAIAIGEGGSTLGLGMGQVNRVDAVEQAIARMQKFHPQHKNPVLSSDAFFPFPDSIERISAAGIRWVIQPGGSIKDEEVKSRARDLGVNMILTSCRHFRH